MLRGEIIIDDEPRRRKKLRWLMELVKRVKLYTPSEVLEMDKRPDDREMLVVGEENE